MTDNNNVSLGEIMGATPRSASIDLTAGVVSAPDSNEKSIDSRVEVSATQSGPVDMSNMKPIDTSEILPRREEKDEMVEDLFSELDEAVDRECESISMRINAVIEAQEREIEENESLSEDLDDDAISNDNSSSFDNDDFSEDLGLDEDDDDEFLDLGDRNRVTAFKNDQSDNNIVVNNNESENVESVTTSNGAEEPIVARIVTNEKSSILDGVSNEDLFSDDDELAEENADDEKTSDQLIEELKKEAKEKITPIKKTFDLSKFTISKKSVNAQKAMKLTAQSRQSIADWALVSANRPISMTGLSGPEILKLNPENSSRNRLNTFRDMYRIMYDHVYDANKPEFETWLKQTRFVDLQHVYFALYMATFSGSNFISYSCPHCQKLFLKDIKFEDMVIYTDDSTRNQVNSILKMDTTTHDNDSYPVDLYQISNSYVFGLRTPSIWNVIIETASLSDKFLEKHADLIDIVSYIDSIYIIKEETEELIPIDTKPDPNDQAKTSARRIKSYYDIIKQLSTEEYYELRSKIASYDEDAGKVSYQIPACTCPDCATEIAANTNISPDNMLFTRHQLAAIASM